MKEVNKMSKYRVIHPRKALWAMRDFINEIHNVEYEFFRFRPEEDDDEAFTRFCNTDEWETQRAVCKIVKIKEANFSAFLDDLGGDTFRIGYNFEALGTKEITEARETFTSRSSMCKGFSNITLALLHELGHFSSEQDFEDYDRETELEFLKSIPVEFSRKMYYLLPDEMSATDWAVEWLQNAENRKIAKRFEKNFFKNFEKTS